MNTRGLSFLFLTISLLGCGASATTQPANAPSSSTTTSAAVSPAATKPEPAKAEAEPAAQPAEASEPTKAADTPETPAAPEACDGEWICLRVALDGKGKVEKRTTKLIGDPAIDATWSQNTDGRMPASFSEASKPVELLLKHLPGKPGQHLAQIVLRANGRETVIHKYDGEEFGYVGFIAAEKDGALLVDLRYMK